MTDGTILFLKISIFDGFDLVRMEPKKCYKQKHVQKSQVKPLEVLHLASFSWWLFGGTREEWSQSQFHCTTSELIKESIKF
jgi:hypothetical protein